MIDTGARWIARLTVGSAAAADVLLTLPLGLDVWERQGDSLVVAASDAQLLEVERRRLARVERLATQAEFEARARGGPSGETGDSGGNGDSGENGDKEGAG